MVSISEGNSDKLISFISSSKFLSFHVSAKLFQISSLTSISVSAESTPNKVTPLKMKGKMLVLSSAPLTIPQQAIAALCPVKVRRFESTFPPTASTPPIKIDFCKGDFKGSSN